MSTGKELHAAYSDDKFEELYAAYSDDNFEEFENIVQTLGTYDHGEVMWSIHCHDRKYLRAVLSHEHTTVDYMYMSFFLEYLNDVTEDDEVIIDLLFARMNPKDSKSAYDLLRSVARANNPKALEITLRQLLKYCELSIDQLASVLFIQIMSEHRKMLDENPIVYIRAFVNAGVDISGFHYILPAYLMTHGKVFPGVARELVKHGIPKSAAYVTKNLKSARYRSRLLMELS